LSTTTPSRSLPNPKSQGKTKSKPTSGQHPQGGKLNDDRSGNTEFAKNQIFTSSSSRCKPYGKKSIQKTLFDSFNIKPPDNHNYSDDVWGHNPVDINDNSVLRVLFSNPRGIKLSTDILETEHSLGRVQSLSAGILGLAETNVNWNNPKVLGALHRSVRKIWRQSSVAKSSTNDNFQSETQPGGTLTMACGHWTSRVIERGVDPFRLGRWSFIVLRGKRGIKILFITAYRVCCQTIQSAGPKKSTAQQFRYLSKAFRDADIMDDPSPRHQFIVDLQSWIESRTDAGYQIILGIDANEPFHGTGGNFTPL
jgi:hypothetical protein